MELRVTVNRMNVTKKSTEKVKADVDVGGM